MFQRTRTQVVAGVASLALLAGTGLVVLTPSAQAASACLPGLPVTCFGAIAPGTAPTTVFPGFTAQPAGDWTTTPTDTAVGVSSSSETWSMFIALDDVNPAIPAPIPILTQPTPASCKAVSLAVGFGAAPKVTNTTAGNTAGFATRLKSSPECTGKGISDILEIYSTRAGGAGAVLKISGITYNVGSGVPTGLVKYKVNDGSFTTVETNAVVSAVAARSADPITLIPPGDASPIKDLVIQEQRASAIGAGGVCVSLADPPTGTTFVTAPAPSVLATGGTGKGTPSAVAVDITGTKLSFTVTPSTSPPPVPTTYTITGLGIDAGATGAVNVDVTAGPCAPSAALFAKDVRLTTIGLSDRVEGANRYATAVAIADANPAFDNLAGKTVVIARGDNFPDALAASYLAGQNGVPIFLTTPASVPDETVAALKDHAVTDVVLVGGTGAISTAVQTFLDNRPTFTFGSSTPNSATVSVTRIAGVDRYATAALVAENPGVDAAGTIGLSDGETCDNDVKTAIVASGENFPDALAAGGLAYGGVGDAGCGSGPIPLLLTPKASVSPATAIAIRDLGIEHVILMGGTGAVSDAVQASIDGLAGVTVVRVAGDTRQDTAVKLANLVLSTDLIGAWNSGSFLVARPDTFPDALAASSLSGTGLAPLYLAESTTNLGATTTQGIVDNPQFLDFGVVLGGTTALSDTVRGQVEHAIASQP